ncbi:hypothetical protein BDW59DRAFT_166877 [Aspergillus cavernicola]|uniref:Ribosomal RNA methyltransferase FtsJ domain-containing protein n=1 Tax=Aspergillus cavernicola TaxID=176166 RepID=A0ABR4HJ57_9EURO
MEENPAFRDLSELKGKSWATPAGDTFFDARQETAKKTDRKTRDNFYHMTKQIGKQLVSVTDLLDLGTDTPRILDLCMAPGGFSATVKANLPDSRIDGLSLPVEIGGLQVMARSLCDDVILGDITMYVSEMGMDDEIPTEPQTSTI